MKKFLFYQKKESGPDEYMVLREGFSFFGFVFGIFYALYHRLWYAVFSLFVVQVIAGEFFTRDFLNYAQITVVNFAIHFYLGVDALSLRSSQLKRNGYEFSDIIFAKTMIDAERMFIDRHQK